MIIVLHPSATPENVEEITREIEKNDCKVCPTYGEFQTILGVVGNTQQIDRDRYLNKKYVEKILSVQEPYKMANRMFHPENTVIQVEDQLIGGNKLTMIAGPCSVESEEISPNK